MEEVTDNEPPCRPFVLVALVLAGLDVQRPLVDDVIDGGGAGHGRLRTRARHARSATMLLRVCARFSLFLKGSREGCGQSTP